MKYIFLIAQGVIFGWVAGEAFPDLTWEFFATVLTNSVLLVAYGQMSKEDL